MSWCFWRKPALPSAQPPAAPTPEPRRRGISYDFLARARSAPATTPQATPYAHTPPVPGVLPASAGTGLAQDEAIGSLYGYAGGFEFEGERQAWLGYPYLAELAQRPEYRQVVETIAKAKTRKWIKLHAAGGEELHDVVAGIDAEMRRLGAQQMFNHADEVAGYFGRSHIFLDTGKDDADELCMPLITAAAKLEIGGLKALRIVEPIWTYPASYNSTNPLRRDFYRPPAWYVNGTLVDASRLLTFIPRPVPDLLKPAYQFGGLSLSQMIKPAVDSWLRTVGAIDDLVVSFSTMVLATDLGTGLTGGDGNDLFARVDAFNITRSNRGCMVIQRGPPGEAETLDNVSTPLGGLDALQSQRQERIASSAQLPMVWYAGLQPQGLNASDEGGLRVFADRIHAQQEQDFDIPLKRLIDLIQLSLFGKIHPGITHTYEPLFEMDETTRAAIRKVDAETASLHIGDGVVTNEEERERLANDENSPYAGLTGPAPEAPQEAEAHEAQNDLTRGAKVGDEPEERDVAA